MKTKTKIIGLSLATMLAAAACDTGGATAKDASTSNKALQGLQQAQPAPSYPWSQLRQNLIDIENAQANTTITTTFFFTAGQQMTEPVMSCPSIGYPLPTTDQLTNPQQYYAGGATLPLNDPTGIFTGDSSGTYVICTFNINGKNQAGPVYWEGDVFTAPGPATWDATAHHVVMSGDLTARAKVGK